MVMSEMILKIEPRVNKRIPYRPQASGSHGLCTPGHLAGQWVVYKWATQRHTARHTARHSQAGTGGIPDADIVFAFLWSRRVALLRSIEHEYAMQITV